MYILAGAILLASQCTSIQASNEQLWERETAKTGKDSTDEMKATSWKEKVSPLRACQTTVCHGTDQ